MFILGLKGSPRKGGNTDYLLSLFLKEAQAKGCKTHTIDAPKMVIKPCTACGYCEQEGNCANNDEFITNVLPYFEKADVIVLAAPVYFYSVPAQIKALIDRTQVLWVRKYKFNSGKVKKNEKKGILLSAGATKGKDLFDGVRLTAKYFFDAVGADFTGDLCYYKVDKLGEIKNHPDVQKKINLLVSQVI